MTQYIQTHNDLSSSLIIVYLSYLFSKMIIPHSFQQNNFQLCNAPMKILVTFELVEEISFF